MFMRATLTNQIKRSPSRATVCYSGRRGNVGWRSVAILYSTAEGLGGGGHRLTATQQCFAGQGGISLFNLVGVTGIIVYCAPVDQAALAVENKHVGRAGGAESGCQP